MCTIRTSFFSSKWGGNRISNYFLILWFYTGKKNVFQQFLYIFKKSFELMIHGLWNHFNFPFLVHVDIWLTTYVPHVDKRGHFIDHISTSSCPRNFWMTPWHSKLWSGTYYRFEDLGKSADAKFPKSSLAIQ